MAIVLQIIYLEYQDILNIIKYLYIKYLYIK